jgi:hypothetical protein
MKQRYEDIDSLAMVIRSQREEIQKHRWIESEKVGHDIGWQRAELEWRRQHANAWRKWLRTQGLVHPIVDVIWSQQEEIEAFKWIESEQRGYDIGWEHAVREWSQKHYEAWRHHIVEDRGALVTRDEPVPRSRRRTLRSEHRSHISAAMKAWWKARRKAGRN